MFFVTQRQLCSINVLDNEAGIFRSQLGSVLFRPALVATPDGSSSNGVQ